MSRKKILLVDDVRYFIEVQKRLLKRTSCEVLTSSDGREALEMALREKPDLILLDTMLPGMNGDECCKAIKSEPSLKDVKIIMTLLEGEENEKDQCRQAGCDDFITKPIDRLLLLEKLKKYLDLIVREHVRMPIKITATYSFNGAEYSCRVEDLSEGGMQIFSNHALSLNTSLLLKFVVPNSDISVMALGTVVRAIDSPAKSPGLSNGYGIKFNKLPTAGRMAIAKVAKH